MERLEEIRERLNKAKKESSHLAMFETVDHYCDDTKYLLEQLATLQAENAALKSDLLDGSKTGYEAVKREITTLKDYNHALKVANDTTFENYKKLEQGSFLTTPSS